MSRLHTLQPVKMIVDCKMFCVVFTFEGHWLAIDVNTVFSFLQIRSWNSCQALHKYSANKLAVISS
jgi:hypothetical protein